MTKDETIALFQKCEEARANALKSGKSFDEAHEKAQEIWNSWAEGQLATRRELEARGKWQLLERRFESRNHWIARHSPEMQSWLVQSRADFSDQKMGVKSLAGTSSPLISFGELIDFRGYIFPGVADFTEAEFLAVVIFDNATFCGPAWFRHLCCNRIADFKWTRFFEQPFFLKATFVQSGDFVNTSFKKGVDFSAISAQSVFILEGAYFGRLPNLRQAHFTEPPSLDHIVLADDVEPGGFWRSIFRRCPTDTPERYRELKRLAVQGHNHDLECKFLYVYLALPIHDCAHKAGRFSLSLYLAVNNALVGIGSSRTSELLKTSACLFGEKNEAPNIAAGYIGLVQSTWSALLIFLFALGVRNLFKIK